MYSTWEISLCCVESLGSEKGLRTDDDLQGRSTRHLKVEIGSAGLQVPADVMLLDERRQRWTEQNMYKAVLEGTEY